MHRILLFLCLFLLVMVHSQLDPLRSSHLGPSPVRSPFDQEAQAEKVERLLLQLEKDHNSGRGSPQSYTLTEAELNAYLADQSRKQDWRGLESLSIELREGSFLAQLIVNTDQLEIEGNQMEMNLIRALFRGRQDLRVDGTFFAQEGMAYFRINKAHLSGTPVPSPVLNGILSWIGRSQEPPCDPTEPFEMPFGITAMKIELEKLTIVT